MAKKQDEKGVPLTQVAEEIQEDTNQATQAATEPVEEVIEPHPEQPDWLIAMQNMFATHTQKIDSRFDAIESRLPKAEEGKKENAQALLESGVGKKETTGGEPKAEGPGESKPTGPTPKRKPGLKLWRHF